MEYCTYCGSALDDDLSTCPNCLAPVSRIVCSRCGNTYTGPFCPACREREEAEKAAEQARLEKEEAERKANSALAGKTILTILMPWFGGYFLIREHVKQGFRIFGIVWCSLLALLMGLVDDFPYEYRVITAILYLCPIIVYLFKMRKSLLKPGGLEVKLTLAAVLAILVIVITRCLESAL